jgi:predicted nucleic acid-binding protein
LTPVVVDSSVVLKWFVPEKHSDRAASLLDGSFELAAPDLLVPECGNILWKKIVRKELSAQEGRTILRALVRAPVAIIGSRDLIEASLEIAVGFGRTIYDGLFVALAVARECRLITADERLARAFAAGPLKANVVGLGAWDGR